MQVSYRKVIESVKELSAAGLIWEKRCGRGNANQIYLALVEHEEVKGGSVHFVEPVHERTRAACPDSGQLRAVGLRPGNGD